MAVLYSASVTMVRLLLAPDIVLVPLVLSFGLGLYSVAISGAMFDLELPSSQ